MSGAAAFAGGSVTPLPFSTASWGTSSPSPVILRLSSLASWSTEGGEGDPGPLPARGCPPVLLPSAVAFPFGLALPAAALDGRGGCLAAVALAGLVLGGGGGVDLAVCLAAGLAFAGGGFGWWASEADVPSVVSVVCASSGDSAGSRPAPASCSIAAAAAATVTPSPSPPPPAGAVPASSSPPVDCCCGASVGGRCRRGTARLEPAAALGTIK
mmetsp:Transcript_24700/g.71310  ORF Transcript_24700/g.71310 Transcript_24700/m.71310 type:complete len:213 (+) Transcript_24700:690-1328(+)